MKDRLFTFEFVPQDSPQTYADRLREMLAVALVATGVFAFFCLVLITILVVKIL